MAKKTASVVPRGSGIADRLEDEAAARALKRRAAGETLRQGEIAAIRRYEGKRKEQEIDGIFAAVHQKRLCEILGGVHRYQVRRWEEAGMPRNGDGTYDLRQVIPWLLTKGAEEKRKLGADEKALAELRGVRIEVERLKLEREREGMVSREEVERGRVERILAVKRALLQIPRIMPQMVVLEAAEATRVMADRVRRILQDFSRRDGEAE